MFGYLYYFIKYRLTVYIANNSIYRDKKYYEFHELPKNRAKTFLEEYQLRVQEKSRVEEELKLQESDK
jgi:hypothetical protein